MKQYHVFDMDGTLVDSMPYWSRKVLRILEHEGIEYNAETLLPYVVTLGDSGTAAYYKTLGVKMSIDEMKRMMDEYALDCYSNRIALKPGVAAYVRSLKEQGCRLYVLTASPRHMGEPCLRRNGVWQYFDGFYSTEDFKTYKNDVKIYGMMEKAIGCDRDDVMFYDDSIYAIRAAKQAGWAVTGVYDEFSKTKIDEIRQTADRYIDGFDELIKEQ